MDTPTGSSYGSDDGRVPAEAPGRGRHIASGRRGESDEGAVPRELAAPPVYPRAPPPAALRVARNFTAHAYERGGGSSSSRVPPAWPDTVVVADPYAYRPRVVITDSSSTEGPAEAPRRMADLDLMVQQVAPHPPPARELGGQRVGALDVVLIAFGVACVGVMGWIIWKFGR